MGCGAWMGPLYEGKSLTVSGSELGMPTTAKVIMSTNAADEHSIWPSFLAPRNSLATKPTSREFVFGDGISRGGIAESSPS
ncbi:MAG: hypothetical protein RL077_1628 [Verrucomicrobiota bacterium]